MVEGSTMSINLELDEDWEEWDPSKGSFVHHMIAGSCAGVVEHVAIFPVDTIKTHVQCQRCPSKKGAFSALAKTRELIRHEGVFRLWRGVSTMFSGCIPAHAAYFTIFESMKKMLGANEPGHHPLAAGLSGALATTAHDAIMTPMDVVKQRLQLGYYKGPIDCFKTVYRHEGARAFYLSFPTTLLMNVPFAMVMAATNESLKTLLNPSGEQNLMAFLVAGAGAGAAAAAVTTPLDVAKTRLQTQVLLGAPHSRSVNPQMAFSGAVNTGTHSSSKTYMVQYRGFLDVVTQIRAQEGWRGFFKGLGPRLLVHTPSVSISWATYETLKRWLEKNL